MLRAFLYGTSGPEAGQYSQCVPVEHYCDSNIVYNCTGRLSFNHIMDCIALYVSVLLEGQFGCNVDLIHSKH